VLRATLSTLLARKLRLLLSALSIVLGVSFVSGAFVLTDSLGRVFDSLFTQVNAGVAVQVRSVAELESAQGMEAPRPLVSPRVIEQVAAVDGVSEVRGDVFGLAQVVDPGGELVNSGPAPAFGVNWYDSPVLNPATLREGRAPRGPDEIVIDAGLAEESGYDVGDRAPVLTEAPRRDYHIVGIFGYGQKDTLAGETTVAFDDATARQVLGTGDSYHQLVVAAEDGVGQVELRDRIRAVLPAGIEAITGEEAADEDAGALQEGLGFFSTFLLVFAAVALFVGAFLIFNTFTMLVTQRTRELALMRALGASRAQVTGSVLAEALVVGTISSVVGLCLGIGVAIGLRALFSAVGAELPAGETVILPRTVIVSFAVGILVTAAAALLPARKAASVPPVAAMRDAATPDRPLRRLALLGAVLLAAGAAGIGWSLFGDAGLWTLGIAMLLAFVGIAALSPLVALPVISLVGAPLSRRLPGRLGRQNAMRNPRRSASTAAALMIGLALVSAVSVLGASTKSSIEVVAERALGAEFVLDTAGPVGFSADVADAVRRIDGVATVDELRADQVRVGESTEFVVALSQGAVGSTVTLQERAGSLTALGPGTVLVDDTEAGERDLSVGDRVEVTTARGGTSSARVVGTYAENQLVGSWVFDESLAESFSTSRVFAALVRLDEGADAAAVRAAIDQVGEDNPGVQVQDQSEFVAAQAAQIDQVIAIITLLLVLSVLIAVLGIVNTLALSVIERTRELGLLRAVGLGRGQLRRMVRVESVILAMFGALLGLVVGSAFGALLVTALADEGLTELTFPLGRLLLFLVLAALAGVIAAWLPARRAARMNVLRAIATE